MQTAHPDLLADILTFCASRNMTKTAFGKAALNDPKFVFDLESGERECRRKTIRRVQAFMSSERAMSVQNKRNAA